MTFVRADLYSDISETELGAIADKLVQGGDPDPVNTTIAEQTSKVSQITSRYVLDDSTMKRLIRTLVLWELYKRLGTVPDRRQKAYDNAMKELVDIRDGKFKNLVLATPPSAPTAGRGSWGSDDNVRDPNFRRGKSVSGP